MPVFVQEKCLKLSISHLHCEPGFAAVRLPMLLTDDPYDPLKPVVSALNNLMGSLAPLQPMMDVLSVALQVTECLKGVKDLPDPTTMINCLPELAKRAAKLLDYVTPLSVMRLVAGMVCLLAEFVEIVILILRVVRAAIRELLDKLAFNVQFGDDDLQAIIGCGQANILADLENLAGLFAFIKTIIEVVNLFLELAGQDPITITFAFTPDIDLSWFDNMIATLQGIDDVLRGILQVIPLGLEMV